MAAMAKIGPEVKTIAGLNALVYLLHGAPNLSDRYFDITGVSLPLHSRQLSLELPRVYKRAPRRRKAYGSAAATPTAAIILSCAASHRPGPIAKIAGSSAWLGWGPQDRKIGRK